jgi:hypothetical protein
VNPAITEHVLNGLCPYFTMFPLSFPLRAIDRLNPKAERVLDPFCGRGTTSLAARLLGLDSVAIDSNPVAVAIAHAKVVTTTPEAVIAAARRILNSTKTPLQVPSTPFWTWAFDRATLQDLCALREALQKDCESPSRVALRGLLLGSLHGPVTRIGSYFSNQSPRTYAPKPRYALNFWRARQMRPPRVDVLALIRRKAHRYFTDAPATTSRVIFGDSRDPITYRAIRKPTDLIITSPPYYGMRTYVPDQWLRGWFMGGPTEVNYNSPLQITHNSPSIFAGDLRRVWLNVGAVSTKNAIMLIRFGGIRDRDHTSPLDILRNSLAGTGWIIADARAAGTARRGKRQAATFLKKDSRAIGEHDVIAVRG